MFFFFSYMFNFWLRATRSLWILVSSNLIPLLLSNWPGELGEIAKKFKRMGGLLFGVDFIGVAFIDRNVYTYYGPDMTAYHVDMSSGLLTLRLHLKNC